MTREAAPSVFGRCEVGCGGRRSGEASGAALNLVINEAVFATQLTVC